MNKYKKAKINSSDISHFLIAFFSFFPFLFPNPLITTDVQPYALLIGLIVFILSLKKFLERSFKYQEVILLFLTIIAIFIGIISIYSYSISGALRALANYLTIFIIPICLLLLNDRKRLDSENMFKVFILIWFFVGMMQFFIDREFMVNLVSGGRISSGYRGCTALAAEPSFYGIQCFYFLYISKGFQKHRVHFYGLNLIMAVFFAQSLVGTIFILTFFIQEFFEKKIGLRKIVIGVGGIALIGIIVHSLINYFPNIRLTELILSLLNNGIYLNDGSGQVRFNSIINSFNMAFGNYLIPMGFQSRIGSAWGGILSELGIFAIGYMIIIPTIFAKFYKRKLAKMFTAIFIFILYLNNVQFGNPMFGFVLGTALIMHRNNSKDQSMQSDINKHINKSSTIHKDPLDLS